MEVRGPALGQHRTCVVGFACVVEQLYGHFVAGDRLMVLDTCGLTLAMAGAPAAEYDVTSGCSFGGGADAQQSVLTPSPPPMPPPADALFVCAEPAALKPTDIAANVARFQGLSVLDEIE